MRNAVIITAAILGLTACGQGEGKAASGDAGGVAQAAAAAAIAPETRSFGDWTAICDNGLRCVAYGKGDGAVGWVRVEYPAGPQATPLVHVAAMNDLGGQQRPVTAALDGRAWPSTVEEDGYSARISDGLAAARALAQGRSLALSIDGEEPTTVSLNGAAAALLWIDEKQGRLNTTTALVRIGERPASAVRAAPSLPLVAAAPAVDQGPFSQPADPEAEPRYFPLPAGLSALPAVAQCRRNLEFNPSLLDYVQAARLAGDKELWLVPCDAGAYNLITLQFLTDAGGANPVQLRLKGTEGGGDDEQASDLELTNADYDAATRTLSQFAKARGIGDCGVEHRWTWTGRDFVLAGERVMGDCIGMVSDLWPTTWRTRAQ